MSVKRYDPIYDEGYVKDHMAWVNGGDYVTFDDYETLASEYDALSDKYKALVDKLGEMFREG